MDKENLMKIVKSVDKKSNKDLNEGLEFLKKEFEQTKGLVINLTLHMESVEKDYNIILDELNKRKGG